LNGVGAVVEKLKVLVGEAAVLLGLQGQQAHVERGPQQPRVGCHRRWTSTRSGQALPTERSEIGRRQRGEGPPWVHLLFPFWVSLEKLMKVPLVM
jgi:hypothetical protein